MIYFLRYKDCHSKVSGSDISMMDGKESFCISITSVKNATVMQDKWEFPLVAQIFRL